MEDDAKPTWTMQRKQKHIMKEVVKAGVLKLLVVDIIYLIVDSKGVSPA